MKENTKKTTLTATVINALEPKEKPFEIRDSKLTGFILRVQPTGKMSYVCQYARGKRVNIGPANVLTPTQARETARAILGDVARGIDPMADKRKVKADTFEAYILNVYAPWVHAHHGNGENTIKMLRAQFFPILGKCKLDEITPWNVEKWRSARLKAGAKPSSLNRYLNALKAALARAVDWNIIEGNPLAKVKPLKGDNQPAVRFLSETEEDRLRAALDAREGRIRQERATANAWRSARGYKLLPDLAGGYVDHLKPLVLLSLNTGLRRGELLNLERGHVADPDAPSLITVSGKTAKTGQTRHVPLNSEAAEILTAWLKQSTGKLVFPLNGVKTSWKNLLKEAQITAFRWHDMRHHFASRLVMSGVDLNTVRELLGHSDLKMTLRYAHLAPQIKAAAVETIVRRQAPDKVIELSR